MYELDLYRLKCDFISPLVHLLHAAFYSDLCNLDGLCKNPISLISEDASLQLNVSIL